MKNQKIKALARQSLDFAVDLIRMLESVEQENKSKYVIKQLFRYGTQIGAKIARGGGNYKSPGFITCYKMAKRRAENTAFWLKMAYEKGYVKHPDYIEIQIRLIQLTSDLDSYLKKIKLYKDIKNINKTKLIIHSSLSKN